MQVTPHDFISSIIEAYKKSKEIYGGNKDRRLFRGKQPSISAIAEDSFGKFISSNFSSPNLKFIIEPIFSFSREGKKRKQTIIPDLAIIQDEVVTHYFDLKMDLGFSRNLKEDLSKKDSLIKDLRGKESTQTWLGKFTFSPKIIYQMVIISRHNANKYLDEYLEYSKTLNTTEVYILTKGTHPNSKMGRESVQENEEVFEKLMSDIKKGLV